MLLFSCQVMSDSAGTPWPFAHRAPLSCPCATITLACEPRAWALEQERAPQWEENAPPLQRSPHSPQLQKSPHAATKTERSQKSQLWLCGHRWLQRKEELEMGGVLTHLGSIRNNGSGGCQSYFPTEVRRQKYFSGMQTGFSILSWLEEKWNMVRESFSCLLFQYFLYICIQLCHRYRLLVSVRWFMGNGVLLRDFATLRIFPKYVSWELSWCSCG